MEKTPKQFLLNASVIATLAIEGVVAFRTVKKIGGREPIFMNHVQRRNLESGIKVLIQE